MQLNSAKVASTIKESLKKLQASHSQLQRQYKDYDFVTCRELTQGLKDMEEAIISMLLLAATFDRSEKPQTETIALPMRPDIVDKKEIQNNNIATIIALALLNRETKHPGSTKDEPAISLTPYKGIANLPGTKLEFLWQTQSGPQSWLQGRVILHSANKVQIASRRPNGAEVLIWLDLPVKMRLVNCESEVNSSEQ